MVKIIDFHGHMLYVSTQYLFLQNIYYQLLKDESGRLPGAEGFTVARWLSGTFWFIPTCHIREQLNDEVVNIIHSSSTLTSLL